jgi:hypothetical protein
MRLNYFINDCQSQTRSMLRTAFSKWITKLKAFKNMG